MKRDLDLIRQILFAVWEHPSVLDDRLGFLSFDGHTQEEVSYHIKLLAQANLLEAVDETAGDELLFRPVCLTWDGQEFLALARNDTNWEKAKAALGSAAKQISFFAMTEALKQLALHSV